MPDALVSFVFSLLLASGATFYTAFMRDKPSALHTALAFALSTATAAAVVPFYGAAVCVLYLPLWAAGYLGGITTVLVSWVAAQAVAYVLGVAPVCWWSSLLVGLLGCVWSRIPLRRGDRRRLALAVSATGIFLLWPLGFTARLLLQMGVLFLLLFARELLQRSMWRAVWQRYLHDGGLVILYSGGGEVMMESAALRRDGPAAEALRRHSNVFFHQLGSVVPIEHAGRQFLMTLSPVALPTGEVGRLASFQDVTRTTRALREKAEFFALATEGFGVCTTEGELILANQALEDMLGCSPGANNPCVMDFVHPDERDQVRMLADTLRSRRREHVRVEVRLRHRGGEYRWANVAGVLSEEEDVIYFVVHDTHARFLRERELTESYRQAVEQTKMLAMVKEAIVVFSLAGVVRYWNRGAVELYGYTARNATAHEEPLLLATRYPSPREEIIELTCRDGSWHGTVARTTARGEGKLVEVRWTILSEEGGSPRDIVEISSDVTAALRDNRRLQQLATIVESTDDAVISLSLKGETLTYNRGAEQMCGFTKEEVCGRPFLELVAEENCREADEALREAAAGRSVSDCRDLFRHKLGTTLCTSSSVFPITDERGKINGISLLARDVTAERVMERESARLELLSVMGQLAAGIGHELRNPLTTVRGFLQFFARNSDLAAVHPQLDIMLTDLDAAHEIISQFLSLARDSGGVAKCLDLNQVVRGVLPMLRADAHMRNCCVVAECRAVPYLCLVEGEVAQLILNLARNGLQAMTDGGVLTISTAERDGVIVLEVSDTGHGITREVAEKMWTPFFTSRDGAVGLGLAVCECIATRQGARITFKTSEQGTTFTVEFGREDKAC